MSTVTVFTRIARHSLSAIVVCLGPEKWPAQTTDSEYRVQPFQVATGRLPRDRLEGSGDHSTSLMSTSLLYLRNHKLASVYFEKKHTQELLYMGRKVLYIIITLESSDT